MHLRILAAAAITLALAPMAEARQVKAHPSQIKRSEVTDVGSARRHGPVFRRHYRHHDGLGGRRVAGYRGRDPGSTRLAIGMDILTADRDGRWGAKIDRPREAAPRRWRSRYASLGPVERQSGPVRRFVTRTVTRAVASIGHGLASIPGELAAKISEIAGACPGFRVISACRPGAKVAGTNITSLHASCRAADIAGPNYGCAYAHLQGWPGGVSTDPERVAHIHLSWAPGSREFGARFRHGGGGHYARHHVRRYAHHWRGRRG